MFHYNVETMNLTTWVATAYGSKNDIVVVRSEDSILPTNVSELIVLHMMHANNSYPMVWDEASGSGAFTCLHCKININVSELDYQRIIQTMSRREFGHIIDTVKLSVYIAHRVTEFPQTGEIGHIYAVELTG